jgi:hypothetical protein
MSDVHICAPSPTGFGLLSIPECPDCKRHTRMVYFDFEWYGREATCLRCGRHWSGGEWMPLAFEPNSRRKSIDEAKKWYRNLRRAEVEARMKEEE